MDSLYSLCFLQEETTNKKFIIPKHRVGPKQVTLLSNSSIKDNLALRRVFFFFFIFIFFYFYLKEFCLARAMNSCIYICLKSNISTSSSFLFLYFIVASNLNVIIVFKKSYFFNKHIFK